MEPLIFIGIMVGLLWLLIIRPQRSRQARHTAMINEVSVDDEIVTAGGMYGRVQRMDEDVLTVEIAPGTTVRIARGAIAEVIRPEAPTAPDDR